jgi:hypothetical protein
MDMQKNQQKNLSEIAQFLELWDNEMESIRQGLKGFSLIARHDFINRRIQALSDDRIIALMTLEAKKAAQNSASSNEGEIEHDR